MLPQLVEGPIRRHFPWLEFVNRKESQAELLLLRESLDRGTPAGDADWQRQPGAQLGQDKRRFGSQFRATIVRGQWGEPLTRGLVYNVALLLPDMFKPPWRQLFSTEPVGHLNSNRDQ